LKSTEGNAGSITLNRRNSAFIDSYNQKRKKRTKKFFNGKIFAMENLKAWVVTADMGYGHQRAVYPLRSIAEDEIITAGSNGGSTKAEQKLWRRVLGVYEFISRAKGIPFVGKSIFNLLEIFIRIPSLYPIRDLSNKTFQVDLLEKSIQKGLCESMIKQVSAKHLPIITSFYAPAIAADSIGLNAVYCIICDADINRVWAAKEPWESKIVYFVPCGRAAQRLKVYGVPNEKILITGFPLPQELTGDENLTKLKSDLGKRLNRLDPEGIFHARHGINVKYFLGEENYGGTAEKKITLTYSVGGAGAQKEIGGLIARSLKKRILNGEIKLNMAAGTKENVKDYFESVAHEITEDKSQIDVIYSESLNAYFDKFNASLHETDILWTKPSELSFYSALGLPIIMAPAIGSQEKANRKWLNEIRAGVKQLKPEYTDQWLPEMIRNGSLAEAAWFGFLKARKLGTYNILEVLKNGRMKPETSPVIR